MVANIFHDHGLWLGPTKRGDTFNRKGYFENNPLKERMKKTHGFDVSGPMPETKSEWKGIVRGILEAQKYSGGSWGFKTGVHYWNVWGDFEPIFIKVMRNRESIVKSYRRYGGVFPKHGVKFIDRGLEKLRELPGFEIDADRLISGDRNQIMDALEGCGFHYRDDIVTDIIDSGLWNES